MSSRGVSVRIFLVDGKPEGLKRVEKSNWTGVALMCSRAQYPSVQSRSEFNGPGVYVLVGPSDTSGQQTIYIGEADIARTRINQHVRGEDFWTHLVLFSSKDTNLNKAHVRYLESRLVVLAKDAKRAVVRNGNVPAIPLISEPDQADVESFLEDMLIIYPLLGITAFDIVKEGSEPTGDLLSLKGKGASAKGADKPGGFLVLRGSLARIDEVPAIHNFLSELRAKLISDGVLVWQGENLVFTQDFSFTSPSTAAGVLLGRPANGRIEWKDPDGRTLKSIQGAALDHELTINESLESGIDASFQ